jgi:hypothetical protein
VNYFRTKKLFSLQALFRTAVLTGFGAGVLLVPAAQASIIYQTNFNTITTTGSPVLSNIASELIGSGNYYSETNYSLPTGWTQLSGDTLAYQFTPDSGGNGSTPKESPGTNYGVLLNSICYALPGFPCTGANVGSIQYAMTGLTIGTSYTVTVDYWGTTAGGGTFNTAANNLGLSVGVTGIGSISSHATIANATVKNTGYVTATYTFVANSTTGALVLTELTNSPANPPAAIVGDVTITAPDSSPGQTTVAPEPSSALFLLAPAVAFFAHRRRSAKK